MSRKEKLLQKLFSATPPKDFTWEELLSIMHRAGFSENCSGGSHYTFEHTSGYRFRISKTHPSGILKPYQVDVTKEAITTVGGANGDLENEQ